MKEEVESVYLKDDTSFKKIVKQEQARRHLNKQQPKEKLVVAINRWKMMETLEELRETIMPQQEYSMLIKEHGLTFPLEVCSQLGLYEGQEVKLWIIDGKNVVMIPQEST
jgi:hypothetical protein